MHQLRAAAQVVLTSLLTAACLLAAAPANADELHAAAPAMTYPIHSSAAEVIVQINAGPRSWNIRRAARRMDADVDGLTIRTSGDCATADMCVEVRAGSYTDAEMLSLSNGTVPEWSGLTTYQSASRSVVFLNTMKIMAYNKDRRARVAAHELGHVLGLDHHDSPGLMTVTRKLEMDWLSADELALLRGWYGSPAARS